MARMQLNVNKFMTLLTKSILPVFFFLLIVSDLSGQRLTSIQYGNNKEAGNFKKVNGIKLYYEIYGEGKPLIFLHGNGGSIAGAKDKIDEYKKYYKVIAIDSRGHGKSSDTVSKELTYVQMADDINVLLDSLKIDSAFISGQSDGGILGLLLAIHHPDKVARLVTFGANIFPGNKAVFNEINELITGTVKTSKDFYKKRLYNLMIYQPNISEKELQKITCPVLLITGDRDAIRLEHSLKIFYNIKNSNLFVMPGATHFGSYEKLDLFNKVVSDFLNKPFSKISTLEIMTGGH